VLAAAAAATLWREQTFTARNLHETAFTTLSPAVRARVRRMPKSPARRSEGRNMINDLCFDGQET